MLKKTFFITIVMLIILVITSMLIFAKDDRGNSNDPTSNERANACYDDGSMAGKCDTELEWQAGWYLIRFEHGLIERDDFPDWLVWVLPPEPLPGIMSPVTSPLTATCPSVVFSCNQLFTCAEAQACLSSGNFALDPNGDGIACNEAPGNLLAGTISCK